MSSPTLHRRDLLKQMTLLGAGAVATASAATAFAQAPATSEPTVPEPTVPPFAINAREHGVVADAQTDVTAAVQKLLDQCGAQGGGTVYLPAGEYLLAGSLNLPSAVTLAGVSNAPPRSNIPTQGTRLLVTGGKGNAAGTPFITMQTDSTLRGLVVFYPEQTNTNPPVAYPWTVASAGGDNMSILDCLFINPYQAVDFGSYPSGRHLIRNLYAAPLHRGIYIDNCLDVGRLENVHLWPFWTNSITDAVAQYVMEQGQALIIGRTDWELISNVFIIAYAQGIRFVDTNPADTSRRASEQVAPLGGGNVMFTGGGADMCRVAVHVETLQGHSGASFCNAQIFGQVVVEPQNTGALRFTGCGYFGQADPSVGDVPQMILGGSGRTSFDHCQFYTIDPKAPSSTMIDVRSGRFSLLNCNFVNSPRTAQPPASGAQPGAQPAPHGPGNPLPVRLGPDVRSAVIVGNDFYSEPAVINESRGKIVIANNVEGTDAQ